MWTRGSKCPSSFASHWAAYQGLFRQLECFRFIYIATKTDYLRKAEERFRSLVKRPLECDLCGEVLRYFAIRKKWENDEYVIPVTRDLEFLNEGRQRFHGENFETKVGVWGDG